MSQRPEPDDDQLFRFLLGEADGATASELEVWSQSTPARQARLGELRALISSLEQVPPADLVAGIDAKIASAQRRRVRRRSWGAASAFAAAACATLIWATQRADLTEELVRKGSGLNTAERWAGVRAFRLEGQGTPAPLEGRLGAGDSLLFAYTNGGPSPFTHLLIFGVGSTGHGRYE